MAVFDLSKQRICIRVVYDGVGGAGKTTNLRQLSGLFAAQRTRDLFSPAEIDGRTLFFDWMQIHGGVVAGFPLMCQVISVPGQVVLTERRRHLLASADVVVYVCDSSAAKVDAARAGLDVLREASRRRDVPPLVLVQANKQDQVDALRGVDLVERVGLPGVAFVEAIARDGMGVVDTFVSAVRSIAKQMQERGTSTPVRLPVRRAETSASVLAALEALEVDPMWAAEMCLEEAANALLAADSEGVAAPPVLPIVEPPIAAPLHERQSVPLPRADVPAGFVWPAHTGRAAIEALISKVGSASTVELDQHGNATIAVGDVRASTSRAQRFADIESARAAIVRSARELSQLGPLLAPETVITLQPTEDQGFWLWTLVPALPSARDWLAETTATTERASRLDRFAAAVAQALAYTTRHGIALDTSPRGFAIDRGRLRYIGDRTPADQSSGPSMLEAALGSFSGDPSTRSFLLERIEHDLGSALASSTAQPDPQHATK